MFVLVIMVLGTYLLFGYFDPWGRSVRGAAWSVQREACRRHDRGIETSRSTESLELCNPRTIP